MRKIFYLSGIIAAAFLIQGCASTYIKSGTEAYENLLYQDAIRSYEKGLKKKTDVPAYRNLADAYMKTNSFGSAKNTYAKLDSISSESIDKVNYGRALMTAREYDRAVEVLSKVEKGDSLYAVSEALINSCQNIESMKRDSFLYEINDIYLPGTGSAFSPVIVENGLLITAEREKSNRKDPYTGLSYTDLYFVKDNGETWSNPLQVGGLNGKYHDGVPTISEDGKTMIYTRSNYKGLKGLDKNQNYVNTMQLYTSESDGEGNWSDPVEMDLNNEEYMLAHPALSKDGKTLYFSSNMPGGQGGMDLWKVEKNGDSWSQPVNLGPSINTSGDEVFPTVYGNDTLYYSSDSQVSMGGLDIMLVTKSGGTWSQPKHLPVPVNSPFDDFGLSLIDANNGYFSSDRKGTKDQVYSFKKYDPDLLADILLVDEIEQTPLEGIEIVVKNLTDGTEETFLSDENGEALIELEPGKEYEIIIENDDYFTVKEEISTLNQKEDKTFEKKIDLKKLVVADNNNGDGNTGENGDGNNSDGNTGDGNNNTGSDNTGGNSGSGKYLIPNILWDYDKAEVRPDAEPYLNQLADLLKDNPNLKVEIASHCDERGSHAYNDKLSNRRAKAVVAYLVEQGVPKKMLTSKGYGKRKMIHKCGDDCTDKQHQENRRTEFTVISKD